MKCSLSNGQSGVKSPPGRAGGTGRGAVRRKPFGQYLHVDRMQANPDFVDYNASVREAESE